MTKRKKEPLPYNWFDDLYWVVIGIIVIIIFMH